jgi:C1A family cysteine protease
MVRLLLLLLTVLDFGAATNLHTDEHYQQEFLTWQHTFGANSDEWNSAATDETIYAKRFQIFKDNTDIIFRHNTQESLSKLGHNQFSLLTVSEFKAKYLTLGPSNHAKGASNLAVYNNSQPLADSVDWVAAGAVTPVKDQGSCGSCWVCDIANLVNQVSVF